MGIERGMQDGQDIVFERESEQSPDYIPGDVIFKIRTQKHSTFVREGDNLKMDMKLTLKEAILGFKKHIKHLDDHYTEVVSNEVVQPFQVRRVPEEGMPHHNFPSQKGDLFIKQIVTLPRRLNEEDKQILRQIFQK
eukprot:TRINITY_DN3760_c0_g1_i5.p1 TRINITY_DN3760_c0_g1~~TRINITY_DN3760_c0_g1_i5.p1  ORF type:complete len:136 (+),score=29.55 TRINITY_DN3760_c0_g1_i5:100-507(+)